MKSLSEPTLRVVACANATGVHRMAYHEWGDADNPDVLLCVHGLTRNGRDFDVLAQRLQKSYRVICPDVVGRGMSDWLVNPMGYQVAQYAADMVTLMAHIQPATLRWVGTSMGGLIAMTYAAMIDARLQLAKQGVTVSPTYRQPPAQVVQPLPVSVFPIHKLVLNDVGPHIEPASLSRIAQYTMQPIEFESFEQCVQYTQTVAASFGAHTQEQWQRLTRHYFIHVQDKWVKHYDPNIGQAFVGITPEMWQQSEQWLWAQYARLTMPQLIVHGGVSDLLSSETVERMLDINPHASLYTVEGVGHAPTLMHDDQVNRIEQFLQHE